ncbi:hypothetical protein GYMLUDRAFT_266224 [Collybiopsis luxurians FD-317 M1]|uniref:Uncharacterized protein n=1 Tax=Collybiopsis luxurians FD-317 M1 TaxID=944289 RepID=A0A0D0BXC4_9AGAR|nr:hypothetical protein GYMLUDRAFT_266224 [Collybiopsis luxurians FD-317 M1]
MEDKYPEARAMLLEAKSAFETIGNQLGAAQCLQSLDAISHAETDQPKKGTSSIIQKLSAMTVFILLLGLIYIQSLF